MNGIYQDFYILRGSGWQDAMPKIEHIPVASVGGIIIVDNLLCFSSHNFRCGKQRYRIEIALQRNLVACALPRFRQA